MNNKLTNSEQYIFPKKDARIIWTLDKDKMIEQYAVYEVCSDQRLQNLHELFRLKKISDFSSGNCYSDWNEWTLEDCLLCIFKYPVPNYDILKEIYKELGKIEEFSKRLSYFNGNYWGVDR